MIEARNLMKLYSLFFALFLGGFAYGQSGQTTFETKWYDSSNKCTPCDYNSNTGEVFSTITKKTIFRGDYDFTYRIEDVIYETVDFPAHYNKSVLPTNADIKITFGTARNENFITANYQPLVQRNGGVEMIKRIEVSYSATMKANAADREVVFASSSVLASGDWYKIGVPADGLYKLTYDDLNALGIAVNSINPKGINIYGNHQTEISSKNWIYRPDDLLKNSILVVGEADLSFDAADYVLFYAKGPDNFKVNSFDFTARRNKIDSLTYYFIHIDNSDAPKRIESVSNSPNPVTHNVNSYNGYAFHENDEENLLKSGDAWYGENLEGSFLTASFTLNVENRETATPVNLKSEYYSSMLSGTGGIKIKVNGGLIEDKPITSNGASIVAKKNASEIEFTSGTSNLNVEVEFYRTSPAAEIWLNFFQFNFRQKLTMGSQVLFVRDMESVGIGNVAKYSVSNSSSSTQIWEISDPANARKVNGTLGGSIYEFTMNSDSLRTFMAFNVGQSRRPIISGGVLGKIANQNLHALPQVDYLIITHESLRPQAERLANIHRNFGTTVHVIDIQKVYNEFGGGLADPVAVRWFAKMFYDRGVTDPENTLKYLCLFGDGTYDPLNRLPKNNYLMPTYNSVENGNQSYSGAYTADDFFGLLDDTEAMSPNDMLDIGIGRIPVSTIESAEQVIDKIEHYMNFGSMLYANADGIQCGDDGYASSFGDWRNRLVLMADDENGGQFVRDCESMSDSTEKYFPEINIVKIYLDSYKQIVTSGGGRYPDVEEAINQNMHKGALVFNYVGHGGETGLAHERVVTIPMIQNWANVNNMPIFVSATCEFSRFDDPERESAGELTLTTPYGGAVGLLTTTRLVWILTNTTIVQNLYTELFKEEDGEPLGLGEIIRRTKNLTLGNENMRNFTLLGDPAMKLGKPSANIVTDSINGVSVSMETDTLKALSKITVVGHVENNEGTLLSGYNGVISPTVFDKWKTRYTLGQDPDSPVLPFETQNNIIYKGKATVTNGKFEFSFVIPKDIDYAFGKGKISYYGNTTNQNNYGYDTSIVVGGVNPNGIDDELGPEIRLFMNDNNFVNGGMTNSNPLFLAEINDENGVNTTGNGIGHDITLILDGNSAEPIVLNNFYEADLDTYQSGKVNYQLSDLEEGLHFLTFKVWDVNNNSSEAVLEFNVVKEEELGISHLLNYPNPFTTNTDFYFEHNQVCNSLNAKIEIFTISGKLVKTIFRTVNSEGFRSEGINWDGRDDFGDRLGRGVYVYRLSIETEQGKKAEKIEKLVLL